jgi:CheY-like chemotaxis protein
MKKILIVLNNRSLMGIFEEWLAKEGAHDLLLLAKNTDEAIKLLTLHSVGIIITELNMFNADDGFHFLAYLLVHKPKTQICMIVNSDAFTVEVKFAHIQAIRLFKKPKKLIDVVKMISRLAENDFKLATVADITVGEIFKLIEIEKKLCLLEVQSLETFRRGFIYFDHGVLYDAFYRTLKGEEAILKMLSWKKFKLSFKPLPLKTPYKNIEQPLDQLLLMSKR